MVTRKSPVGKPTGLFLYLRCMYGVASTPFSVVARERLKEGGGGVVFCSG
jgi:hypothetical protein